jgi:hypothetical protein
MGPCQVLWGDRSGDSEVGLGEHGQGDVAVQGVVAADLIPVEPEVGLDNREALLVGRARRASAQVVDQLGLPTRVKLVGGEDSGAADQQLAALDLEGTERYLDAAAYVSGMAASSAYDRSASISATFEPGARVTSAGCPSRSVGVRAKLSAHRPHPVDNSPPNSSGESSLTK